MLGDACCVAHQTKTDAAACLFLVLCTLSTCIMRSGGRTLHEALCSTAPLRPQETSEEALLVLQPDAGLSGKQQLLRQLQAFRAAQSGFVGFGSVVVYILP